MAWKQQQSNLEGVARGVQPGQVNLELKREIESLRSRLAAAENRIGAVAIDTGKGAPVAAPPPRAVLDVAAKPVNKVFVVSITNPQFRLPRSLGNEPHAPIYHRLRYSPAADFSSSVVSLPISSQTHFTVHEDPSTALHFKLESSYDGVHWNQSRTKGPVSV